MNYDVISLLYQYLPQQYWWKIAILNKNTYKDYQLLKLPKIITEYGKFYKCCCENNIEDIKHTLRLNRNFLNNWKLNIYLDIVCQLGHKELTKLFIKYGANNYIIGIQSALSRGHKEIVDLLVNIVGNNLEENLDEIVRYEYNTLEFVFPAFIKYHDRILEIACQRKNRDVIEFLINNGVVPVKHKYRHCKCEYIKNGCLLL